MVKLKVLISDTHNPWFNLATENYIFNDMDPELKILFLWRNQETVVIGRFQNPWVECNLEKMESDGVLLARRQSGGGAVFHDLGNTNFTFMSSKSSFDKQANNQILINAAKRFGVTLVASGRNDLVVPMPDGERKISGSAFKENSLRAFHHGTLLINTNISKLANYLNPNKKKLESKGVASVRARVMNLSEINSEITHESLSKVIIEEFFNYYNSSCEIETLDQNKLAQLPELNEYFQFLQNWDWRFGKTPQFSNIIEERFSFGQFTIHLDIKSATITQVKLFSDCLDPILVEVIEKMLPQIIISTESIDSAISKSIQSYPNYESALQELKQTLITHLC